MENVSNRKKIIIAAVLAICLFVAVFVTIRLAAVRKDLRQRTYLPEQAVQEPGIRKLGLTGQANLLLSAANPNVATGGIFEVESKVELTDSLKISGADIVVLYDKSKLEVIDLIPNIKTVYPDAPFDIATVVTHGGSFDDTFNFLRVAEVASRSGELLVSGTINLAKITFRAKAEGGGVIKYPDDNKYFEIVGTGTSSPIITPSEIPAVIRGHIPPTGTTTPVPSAVYTLTPAPSQLPTPTPTVTHPPSTPTVTVVPSSPTPTVVNLVSLGDLNNDGKINQDDVTIMTSDQYWQPFTSNYALPTLTAIRQKTADLNKDNMVDEKDLTILLDNWKP